MVQRILSLKRQNDSLYAWEIRETLRQEVIQGRSSSRSQQINRADMVPSISSINRILRQYHFETEPKNGRPSSLSAQHASMSSSISQNQSSPHAQYLPLMASTSPVALLASSKPFHCSNTLSTSTVNPTQVSLTHSFPLTTSSTVSSNTNVAGVFGSLSSFTATNALSNRPISLQSLPVHLQHLANQLLMARQMHSALLSEAANTSTASKTTQPQLFPSSQPTGNSATNQLACDQLFNRTFAAALYSGALRWPLPPHAAATIPAQHSLSPIRPNVPGNLSTITPLEIKCETNPLGQPSATSMANLKLSQNKLAITPVLLQKQNSNATLPALTVCDGTKTYPHSNVRTNYDVKPRKYSSYSIAELLREEAVEQSAVVAAAATAAAVAAMSAAVTNVTNSVNNALAKLDSPILNEKSLSSRSVTTSPSSDLVFSDNQAPNKLHEV